jgi:hypothetical protein
VDDKPNSERETPRGRHKTPAKKAALKIGLTELKVRKAKPKKGAAYSIWDTKLRGLALRVQPSGRRSWYVIYSFGRPRWLRLGDATAIGLSDARASRRRGQRPCGREEGRARRGDVR